MNNGSGEIQKGDIVISPDGKRGRVVAVHPHALEVQWFRDMSIEIIRDTSRYEVIPAGEEIITLIEHIFHIPVRAMITRANFRYAIENSIPNNELWQLSVYNQAFVDAINDFNSLSKINHRFHIINTIIADIKRMKN